MCARARVCRTVRVQTVKSVFNGHFNPVLCVHRRYNMVKRRATVNNENKREKKKRPKKKKRRKIENVGQRTKKMEKKKKMSHYNTR